MNHLSQLSPTIELKAVDSLKPYKRNARTHSRKQIDQIARSIERFGFTNPILIGSDNMVLAGHGRLVAAQKLGLGEIPCVRLDHLSPDERRAYVLADNKLALNAGWDVEILAGELQELIDCDFEVELTGFSLAEIDLTLDAAEDARVTKRSDRADMMPPVNDHVVTRTGDCWLLDRHRLVCGDGLDLEVHRKLLGDEQIDLVFTDPPYNVPIDGHVCGLGRIRHREFAMGAGEMSSEQFARFLADSLKVPVDHCKDGAILYICMDWRHVRELLDAADELGLEQKNLCVWNKLRGGMGAFYRSQHELVFVFKKGEGEHTNNFGLGDTGRYRTNVWDYRGILGIHAESRQELEMHPTVKPVALVADAIRDCSKRGEIVFDGFGGSGTTLMAAHMVGRIARLIEIDPAYCDTIIRRFEMVTGKRAMLEGSGETFEAVEEVRKTMGGPQ